MNKLITLLLICFCLTSCLRGGTDVEIDATYTLKGSWKQSAAKKTDVHYIEITNSTMKYYHYDENNNIVYLINGGYRVQNDSIYAKDLKSKTYRNYHYNIPYCDLLIFDDIKNGFARQKD